MIRTRLHLAASAVTAALLLALIAACGPLPAPMRYLPYEGTSPASTATGQVSEGTITTPDGRTRHFRLYVPASLPSQAPVPLLVALHGGMGTSTQFAINSGFDALAESNRFIVVYPDGIGNLADGTGLQTWNGGYCCGPAAANNVDDVGFIRAVINRVRSQFTIDPDRTYAAGHSNGAIMAYRLACELSDLIVGVGLQAGSLGVDACTPSRPVSVFHLHGTADTNHPIAGGTGTGIAGVVFRPARSAVDALAGANHCVGAPTVSIDPSNPDVVATTWAQCDGTIAVKYVVVNGATHAWMGHPAASPLAATYLGEPYPKLDASRAIWSFLAAHPRA
jgi:polyhydroxybutyrate depolymerase